MLLHLDALRGWFGRAFLITSSALVAYLSYRNWDYAPQAVLAPALILCVLFVVFTTQLHERDRQFPLADIGFVCMAATLSYVALPLFFYVLSGSDWTSVSDDRLVNLRAYNDDLETFGWDGFFYMVPLGLAYLLTRGRFTPGPARFQSPSQPEIAAVLVVLAGCLAYQYTIETIYSTHLIKSNLDIAAQSSPSFPQIVAQMNNVVLGIGRLARIYLIVLLVGRAREHLLISLLMFAWLSYEVWSTLQLQGGRTYVAVLMMAALFAYHRVVRPLNGPLVVLTGAALMTALLAYGYYRGIGQDSLEKPNPLSAATEFQTLMATALHVKWLVATGLARPVPWQVQWGEVINIVPQQLLPFEKVDPSNWYLSFLNDTSGGYMFGVMSQAAIGAGRLELVLRGLFLGAILGIIQRAFAKPGRPFLAVVFHIWLLTVVYYTYRATTLYLADWAILYFLPFLLITRIISMGLVPILTSLAPRSEAE